MNALVEYTGTAAPFGDLNKSGAADAGDWPLILANMIRDVSALEGVAQYLAGDLTGDGMVDRADFRAYKDLLAAGSGSGLGQSTIPEPTSLVICFAGVLAIGLARLRRNVLRLAGCLVGVAALTSTATAADIYLVSTSGEIKVFSGIGGRSHSCRRHHLCHGR